MKNNYYLFDIKLFNLVFSRNRMIFIFSAYFFSRKKISYQAKLNSTIM